MTHPIHVGVGGWTFEPWRGVFYPEGLVQKRELEYAASKLTSIEIRHLLFDLQARQLAEVARRDARRFRLFGQGQPLLHQSQGAGRRSRELRPFPVAGPDRAGRQAGADQLAVHTLGDY